LIRENPPEPAGKLRLFFRVWDISPNSKEFPKRSFSNFLDSLSFDLNMRPVRLVGLQEGKEKTVDSLIRMGPDVIFKGKSKKVGKKKFVQHGFGVAVTRPDCDSFCFEEGAKALPKPGKLVCDLHFSSNVYDGEWKDGVPDGVGSFMWEDKRCVMLFSTSGLPIILQLFRWWRKTRH
jgi:hypothetical protein